MRFRAARVRRPEHERRVFSTEFHHMIDSPSVCGMMAATSSGAQTERRGGAGPARGLFGGKAAPAVYLLLMERTDAHFTGHKGSGPPRTGVTASSSRPACRWLRASFATR